MPDTLNKSIIIGYPGSGKTTLLDLNAKREGRRVFDWRDYRCESLERTIETIVSEMKRHSNEGESLFMDEPFFLFPPILELTD